MFVNLSIHYPRPGYEPDLIASMHRFGAAAAGAPGLLHVATLKDEESTRLIGLMVWTSRAAWEAGIGPSERPSQTTTSTFGKSTSPRASPPTRCDRCRRRPAAPAEA